jgi:hypothetical protein
MLTVPLQFATQFLASYHYVANHHGFESLGPNDKIADKKPDDIPCTFAMLLPGRAGRLIGSQWTQ